MIVSSVFRGRVVILMDCTHLSAAQSLTPGSWICTLFEMLGLLVLWLVVVLFVVLVCIPQFYGFA